jgi:hypothetical protein
MPLTKVKVGEQPLLQKKEAPGHLKIVYGSKAVVAAPRLRKLGLEMGNYSRKAL